MLLLGNNFQWSERNLKKNLMSHIWKSFKVGSNEENYDGDEATRDKEA